MAFDLDAFIAGINNDKVIRSSSKDRVNRVLMNKKDNQGTLTFIPVYSTGAENFYMKVTPVYEFFGDTSVVEAEDGIWYKVLPIEYYGELTEEQIALYNEVKGYFEYLKDSGKLSYDELRVRNYSLLYGILKKLKNTENKENTELIDCPCLFVYPSLNVITQLCDAINNKIDIMNGRRDWIQLILSLNETGRKGVVQVKFVKSASAGYDCTVTFEVNSEMNTVIDPEYCVSQETQAKFEDILSIFIGWMYDRDAKSYFHTTAFKELRDQLKLRIKDIKGEGTTEPPKETLENKNNLTGTTPSAKPTGAPF